MLDVFEILQPATPAEAAALLAERGDEAAIYAGGTELLLVMKEGLAHFPYLIDLKTVPGLDSLALSADGAALEIGPLARHAQIERSAVVRQHAPLLAEVVGGIANPRVRASGTLGGNLCFAEPHSDPATLLLAWGASVELTSPHSVRCLPLDSFFTGILATARQPDEVLTLISLPRLPQGMTGAYAKFATHERPTATVAALVQMAGGVVQEARIVVGSAGPYPVRAREAEAALTGAAPSEAALRAAGQAAAQAIDPLDDQYGSGEYKRHLAGVLTMRGLAQAVARASEQAAHVG